MTCSVLPVRRGNTWKGRTVSSVRALFLGKRRKHTRSTANIYRNISTLRIVTILPASGVCLSWAKDYRRIRATLPSLAVFLVPVYLARDCSKRLVHFGANVQLLRNTAGMHRRHLTSGVNDESRVPPPFSSRYVHRSLKSSTRHTGEHGNLETDPALATPSLPWQGARRGIFRESFESTEASSLSRWLSR